MRAAMVLAASAALLLTATPAAIAANPKVAVPTPQAVSDCYQRCTSPALVRTTTPTLTVVAKGLAGYFLTTRFEVRAAQSGQSALVAAGESSFSMPPTHQSWQVPSGALHEGVSYFWRARSTNENGVRGDWTRWQELTVDVTRPDTASVSSLEYPQDTWGAVLGTPGTFDFSSPSPDVVHFVWYFGGGDWHTVPATGTVPRTASVVATPPRDMTQVLTFYALDAAGNRTENFTYRMLVTPPPIRFSHWTLDEAGGSSQAADSGNLGAAGTLSGDVEFGAGYVGGSNGAVFSGPSGRITTAGTVLDTSASFTVMGWFNLADTASDQVVVSQDGFRLYFRASDGLWCFDVATHSMCVGSSSVGEWVHVAARFDHATGEAGIFVRGHPYSCDGEMQVAENATGAGSTTPLVIGGGFVGSIDDVQAHQRAISDPEICMHAMW